MQIKPNDQLPKTVCLNCVRQVESTHRFVRKILLNKQILKFGREHPMRRAQMDSQIPDGESSQAGSSQEGGNSLQTTETLPEISEESESDFELDDPITH